MAAGGNMLLLLSSTSARLAGLGLRPPGIRLGMSLRRPAHTSACLLSKDSGNLSDSDEEVDAQLAAAARDVAQSVGGGQKVESALLQQLRKHDIATNAGKAADVGSLGDLISGLRVEQGGGPRKSRISEMRSLQPRRGDTTSDRNDLQNFQGFQRTRSQAHDRRPLLEGKRLGVFRQEDVNSWESDGTTLWDEEQTNSLATLTDLPPRNGFEEMIKWTKEGKLWTFPIQNDQGMEEEAAVGFHEHVFLEDLLEDFPKKGPIRHFMELVVIGLSKNPYLTLQQKREHVDGFRKYFQENEYILRSSGSLNT